ncbi:MAG: IS5 family transposase [Myxococcota bacterium]
MTDREWDLLQPLVAELDTGWGRPPKHDRREMLDAMFYVVRSGCSWRWLPAHYPPWQTVYAAFRTWNDRGWFQQVCDALRESWREQIGRDAEPSAGIVDSQTMKTTEKRGIRGYDGGKKIVGRKRHILVDTEGLPIAICVHEASLQDRQGAQLVFDRVPAERHRLAHLWADSAYVGASQRAASRRGWRLEVVRRPSEPTYGKWQPRQVPMFPTKGGFILVRRRWVVERTFGWLGRYRRLSKDYEALVTVSEGWLWMATMRLLTRRLGRG